LLIRAAFPLCFSAFADQLVVISEESDSDMFSKSLSTTRLSLSSLISNLSILAALPFGVALL
jgi:hypothetical protein